MNTQIFIDLAASEEASGYPDNAAQLRAVPELVAALQHMIKVWEGPRERAALGFAQAVNEARAALAPFQKEIAP